MFTFEKDLPLGTCRCVIDSEKTASGAIIIKIKEIDLPSALQVGLKMALGITKEGFAIETDPQVIRDYADKLYALADTGEVVFDG